MLAYCWSHVRRGFYDLARSKTAPVAEEALQRIAEIYAAEAEFRGKPSGPGERLTARHARTRPLVEGLFAWFEAQVARLPGRSPTAEAIRYALNRRDGLVGLLEDGQVEVDTNVMERAIRPIALSRKNALSAGSDEGGENWAAVASLVETCKFNGVEHAELDAALLRPGEQPLPDPKARPADEGLGRHPPGPELPGQGTPLRAVLVPPEDRTDRTP